MTRSELPIDAEEYLSWLVAERGRSANTVAAYRRDLAGYCEWLRGREKSVLDVKSADIDAFVAERRAEAAASSVARQLAVVRNFHRFLVAENRRRDDPTADLDGVRVPAGIPKPLSEEDV
ncbi:MAG: tyrosine recombinase XerD, partial [Actinomycetota bacterium]